MSSYEPATWGDLLLALAHACVVIAGIGLTLGLLVAALGWFAAKK